MDQVEECMGCTGEACRGARYIDVVTHAGLRIMCRLCAHNVEAALQGKRAAEVRRLTKLSDLLRHQLGEARAEIGRLKRLKLESGV